MILSVFGGVERRSEPWDARYASPVITILGGTELDFRLAELGEGETEVVIVSAVGGVEVTVPDDLPVMVGGVSVLGSRNVLGTSEGGIVHGTDHGTPDFHNATGKRLRLSVFSVLGGVDIRRAPALTPVRPMEV